VAKRFACSCSIPRTFMDSEHGGYDAVVRSRAVALNRASWSPMGTTRKLLENKAYENQRPGD